MQFAALRCVHVGVHLICVAVREPQNTPLTQMQCWEGLL
jgi:hypothetical protein